MTMSQLTFIDEKELKLWQVQKTGHEGWAELDWEGDYC